MIIWLRCRPCAILELTKHLTAYGGNPSDWQRWVLSYCPDDHFVHDTGLTDRV